MAFLCGVFLSSALTIAAAPAPRPAPSQTATPNPLTSFSAAGWLSLKAVSREKIASLRAVIRVSHEHLLTRIDLGNVNATANDGKGEVAQPFPSGTLTIVIDQGKRIFTLWSSRRPLYYESALTPSMSVSISNATNVVSEMSAFTKFQLLSFSLNLIGHQPIDGHAASVFEIDSKVQKQGGKIQNTIGHVALADDLSGLPIHADVTIGAGEPSTVTMQMDLTAISTGAPALSQFMVPKAYKRTKRMLQILMALAPAPH